MSRSNLRHAAELLDALLPHTTPAPWRDSAVNSNRYASLVSDTCIRDCDDYAARYSWQDSHPHDGYGGCLVAESMANQDRRAIAVLRNVADHLPALLRAVAQEDPIQAGHAARAIAAAVIDTHTPRSST